MAAASSSSITFVELKIFVKASTEEGIVLKVPSTVASSESALRRHLEQRATAKLRELLDAHYASKKWEVLSDASRLWNCGWGHCDSRCGPLWTV